MGAYFAIDLKLWVFGSISTKDDLSSEEFHDGKVTSEHSATFNILGYPVFGDGFEHKIDGDLMQSDYKKVKKTPGVTTKIDKAGTEQVERGVTVFGAGLLLFSVEWTKDIIEKNESIYNNETLDAVLTFCKPTNRSNFIGKKHERIRADDRYCKSNRCRSAL